MRTLLVFFPLLKKKKKKSDICFAAIEEKCKHKHTGKAAPNLRFVTAVVATTEKKELKNSFK